MDGTNTLNDGGLQAGGGVPWSTPQRDDPAYRENLRVVREELARFPMIKPEGVTKPASSKAVLQPMSEILSVPVRWLWEKRIALGKVSLLAGDPGLGKSLVTLDMIARVTTGRDFPDGSKAVQGSAILLSAEDDPGDTIRPRLDAAGADVSMVHLLRAVRRQDAKGKSFDIPFDLTADIDALEAALDAISDVVLIVIDPITAYLPHTDTHRNAAMRVVLAPLSDLAARRQVAVVSVDHLNKSERQALYRVSGSIASVASARAVWLFTRDKADANRRLMLPLKNNLAGDQAGLAYRIKQLEESVEDIVYVAWESEPVLTDANEALSQDAIEERSAVQDATAWLRDQLGKSSKPASELRTSALTDGLCWRTVERAKSRIGVNSLRENNRWVWKLPVTGGVAVLTND